MMHQLDWRIAAQRVEDAHLRYIRPLLKFPTVNCWPRIDDIAEAEVAVLRFLCVDASGIFFSFNSSRPSFRSGTFSIGTRGAAVLRAFFGVVGADFACRRDEEDSSDETMF